MATVKDIKINSYCDAVNNTLTGMKMRIDELREDLRKTYGAESDVVRAHELHLLELADIIDWKLQILMKVCPFDWEGASEDVESVVSVGPPEKAPETEFSGGYLGG